MMKIKYQFKVGIFILMIAVFFTSHTALAEGVVNDPCPIPEDAASENPLDLADVQSDIDILKLCVERANLLKQLNNLVKDPMEDKADKQLRSLNNQTKKLANDDLFDLPDFNEEGTDTSSDARPNGTEQGADQPRQKKKKPKPTEPTLVNIFGNTKTGITADVRTTDGLLKRVKVGDEIEKDIIVKEISTQGVVASKEGQDIYLKWD